MHFVDLANHTQLAIELSHNLDKHFVCWLVLAVVVRQPQLPQDAASYDVLDTLNPLIVVVAMNNLNCVGHMWTRFHYRVVYRHQGEVIL